MWMIMSKHGEKLCKVFHIRFFSWALLWNSLEFSDLWILDTLPTFLNSKDVISVCHGQVHTPLAMKLRELLTFYPNLKSMQYALGLLPNMQLSECRGHGNTHLEKGRWRNNFDNWLSFPWAMLSKQQFVMKSIHSAKWTNWDDYLNMFRQHL